MLQDRLEDLQKSLDLVFFFKAEIGVALGIDVADANLEVCPIYDQNIFDVFHLLRCKIHLLVLKLLQGYDIQTISFLAGDI